MMFTGSCSEEYGLESAAFQIIRGGVIPMDLVAVQTDDGRCEYSQFGPTLGFLADLVLDLEFSKFRWLGNKRYMIGK